MKGCCKFPKARAEVQRRSEGNKESLMGGNGRESQFCVSVCVRLLPRKTRPQ